ncbi:MAG: hypothetical protein U0Q18_00295 [Bryobacteraceae bacterium]
MAVKRIHWDRNKLYNEIWEKPATQVAMEYGISDVGLGKVCRQLNIPKPERGYWRRKELGLKVRKATLPEMELVPHAISTIHEREPQAPLSPKLLTLAAREAEPGCRITVNNEPGDDLHPLVRKTLRALERGKANEAGYLIPSTACLDVSVTSGQLLRAISILDALTRALAERGHKVCVDGDRPHLSATIVNGERLEFDLKEKVTRRDRELSAAEIRERKQNPYRYWAREYSYTATGELTFSIRDSDLNGVPVLWRDGKRRKLEDCLNDIVFAFARAAERKVEIREERRRRAEEERERERIRLQKMADVQKEEARVKRLHDDTQRWVQSEQIRAYVAARITAQGQSGAAADRAWVEWALAQADRLDPLRPSPPSILDEKVARW